MIIASIGVSSNITPCSMKQEVTVVERSGCRKRKVRTLHGLTCEKVGKIKAGGFDAFRDVEVEGKLGEGKVSLRRSKHSSYHLITWRYKWLQSSLGTYSRTRFGTFEGNFKAFGEVGRGGRRRGQPQPFEP